MKIATWNVNGIRARQDEVAAFVERERPDVVCLQEIKAAADHIPKTICELPGYWCYWHGTKGYSGVALHVRRELATERPAFTHPAFDEETRVAAAEIAGVAVASIYVPNGGKDFPAKMRFLEGLSGWATETQTGGRTLLICGDLNVAREERDVHPKERKPNQIGTRPEERTRFAELLGTGLVDVGRSLDPDNDELFTWWAPWRSLRQRNIGWRIDYVLASNPLASRATGSASRREFGTSDHAPLVVTFQP
jgi:exodeoxyribonuclease-3